MKITKADIEAKDAEIKLLQANLETANGNASTLRAQLTKAQEETAAAIKDRDLYKGSQDYHVKEEGVLKAELEQLHALLDVFPGCLPRESDEKETYQRTRYTAMTRLASWLANRGTLAVSVKSAE